MSDPVEQVTAVKVEPLSIEEMQLESLRNGEITLEDIEGVGFDNIDDQFTAVTLKEKIDFNKDFADQLEVYKDRGVAANDSLSLRDVVASAAFNIEKDAASNTEMLDGFLSKVGKLGDEELSWREKLFGVLDEVRNTEFPDLKARYEEIEKQFDDPFTKNLETLKASFEHSQEVMRSSLGLEAKTAMIAMQADVHGAETKIFSILVNKAVSGIKEMLQPK